MKEAKSSRDGGKKRGQILLCQSKYPHSVYQKNRCIGNPQRWPDDGRVARSQNTLIQRNNPGQERWILHRFGGTGFAQDAVAMTLSQRSPKDVVNSGVPAKIDRPGQSRRPKNQDQRHHKSLRPKTTQCRSTFALLGPKL